MALRIVEFLAIVLAALALVPVGAHLAALPNKIDMDADSYLAAQQIYAGWAWFAVIDIAAIVMAGALAFMLRGGGAAFWFGAGACALQVVAMIVFFLFVFPGNQATQNWTSLPDNWQALRTSWEYGHGASGIITFFAFVAIVLAVLV
jgi:hypothetical protein